MNKKKFEVPYNFETEYLDKILELKEYFEYIKFIYMPAFDENYLQNTREETIYPSVERSINYKNWDNYLNIIKGFQSIGLDICILIQRNASLKLVEKYINLGIKYFVINDDQLAKTIKKKYKDIYLILSITRNLSYDDIFNEDLSMYDEIVLMFWFNRHLQYIKKLPTKYKYAILTNSECNYKCTVFKEHWWNKIRGEKFNKCPCNAKDTIKIYVDDLIYFDQYIESFKLTDRAFQTKDIISILKLYLPAYKNIDSEKFDIEKEKHYCLE